MSKSRLKKCVVCEEYTLAAEHHGKPTISPHPQKWSPADKLAKYRRKQKGLI